MSLPNAVAATRKETERDSERRRRSASGRTGRKHSFGHGESPSRDLSPPLSFVRYACASSWTSSRSISPSACPTFAVSTLRSPRGGRSDRPRSQRGSLWVCDDNLRVLSHVVIFDPAARARARPRDSISALSEKRATFIIQGTIRCNFIIAASLRGRLLSALLKSHRLARPSTRRGTAISTTLNSNRE